MRAARAWRPRLDGEVRNHGFQPAAGRTRRVRRPRPWEPRSGESRSARTSDTAIHERVTCRRTFGRVLLVLESNGATVFRGRQDEGRLVVDKLPPTGLRVRRPARARPARAGQALRGCPGRRTQRQLVEKQAWQSRAQSRRRISSANSSGGGLGVRPLRLRSAITSRAVSPIVVKPRNPSSLSSDVLPTPGPPVTRTPITRTEPGLAVPRPDRSAGPKAAKRPWETLARWSG